MKIVQKALFWSDDERVTFYVNPDKDDWGTLNKRSAEKGGRSTAISVETISLKTLFNDYGVPRYIKCDLEGGDTLFCRSLVDSRARPDFVSIEYGSIVDNAALSMCGYELFQAVNQWKNAYLVTPRHAREGNFAEFKFDFETSGLFGLELPQDRWVSFDAIVDDLRAWTKLRASNDNLAWGWLDVHATTRKSLGLT